MFQEFACPLARGADLHHKANGGWPQFRRGLGLVFDRGSSVLFLTYVQSPAQDRLTFRHPQSSRSSPKNCHSTLNFPHSLLIT
jgi:hypothetical protein